MSERCASRNRSGKRCGAWALTGATRCALHSDPRRAAQLGSKHGCRRLGVDPIGLPYKALKTMVDVTDLMEETINRVRQGSLDLRSANTIGFLASIQMKALELAKAEAPETTNGSYVYECIFNRPGAVIPPDEVYDLYPQPQQKDPTPTPEPLPAPSESVDDPQNTPRVSNNHPSIITVEIIEQAPPR